MLQAAIVLVALPFDQGEVRNKMLSNKSVHKLCAFANYQLGYKSRMQLVRYTVAPVNCTPHNQQTTKDYTLFHKKSSCCR